MKKWLVLMLLGWVCNTAAAQQSQLLLSELLYQPLSGEAEYVELYNAGSTAVELADYHIVRWLGDTLGKHYPLPQHTLAPNAYVVLTNDAASVAANYTVQQLSTLVECALPPYPNVGGSVVLCHADTTIADRLDYTPDMHSRLLRNKAGVSLERRSFSRPTAEKSNWFSAASTAGYGTPGYDNSQSAEYLVEATSFAYSTTTLSPDGDGYQDELVIAYSLDNDDGLSARAEVYDAHGLLVRRLLDGDLLGTHGELVWDGHDETGLIVSRGQYVVVITVYDRHGTRQTLRNVVALP